MPGPLRAGDRMARPSSGGRSGGGSGNGGGGNGGPPDGPEDGGRNPRPKRDRTRARRRSGAGYIAARAVTGLFALGALLVVAGGIGGYAVYRYYTAGICRASTGSATTSRRS